MQLVVFHYHFRPGGVRRVIEQGLPELVRALGGVTRVVMMAGERADPGWKRLMESALFPCPVEWCVEPVLGYWSEQHAPAGDVRASIRDVLRRLLLPGGILWAHNLCVGRNMLLAQELASLNQGTALWLHHHDWWWDGRWERWPEMQAQGISSLQEAMAATLPCGNHIRHFCINTADARRLREWTGMEACFLPNPVAVEIPRLQETESARAFLRRLTGMEAPWVYACRTLRRKNIAEALLVQRWLAPDAATVTTGGPSSASEQPYYEALKAAAAQKIWPLYMGVCGNPDAPAVSSLMASASVLTVTSLREGFGLAYQEAASLGRPLLARVPGGIEETMEAVGFQFRCGWKELRIPRHFFDETAETSRVTEGRERLKGLLPQVLHGALEVQAESSAGVADFGRLSLSAQLEVLSVSPETTRAGSFPLNPVLIQPGSVQPPAARAWHPGQWAGAMINHGQRKWPQAFLPDWSQDTSRLLMPATLAWLEHPLLWENGSGGL